MIKTPIPGKHCPGTGQPIIRGAGQFDHDRCPVCKRPAYPRRDGNTGAHPPLEGTK